ncbi:LexA family protein [Adhaeribacter radiodurans]|uniref:Translesion error-prone DNA polymerase V autoproteolytic subunit n=1 Tax=Adhaeribacter radiodurans TaxID=2745197 RepID=A0A7L7L185_9BACT|nr:translesion error-prone DNA polymerase V autoproteolytic subunit [Adhaeribacter radiodurans]QMU26551.1 translesion error-prone DNA polymerase V autoproteolytic subunit [Adhaeribacter radiodurans]
MDKIDNHKQNQDAVNLILLGYETETKLPLFSSYVKAGFPSPAEDYAEERISLLKFLSGNPTATFYVLLEGDSMIDFHLFEGDLLVIDRSLEVRSGDIILANLDNEFTVKMLEITENGARLVPGNKKYKPIVINNNLELLVWGVVRGIARRFRK